MFSGILHALMAKAGSSHSESGFSTSILGDSCGASSPTSVVRQDGRPVWDLLLACPLQLGTTPQPSSLISDRDVCTPEVTDPLSVSSAPLDQILPHREDPGSLQPPPGSLHLSPSPPAG